MKKSIIVIFSLVCFVIISCSITKQAATVGYENLKVLPKNTNKREMDSVMKHFTASLGVKCNFCHIQNNDAQKNWNFASDEKKNKAVARDMMRMTADINKKYFDVEDTKSLTAKLEVTCYSCHQGKEHPAKRPPAPPAR